MLFITYKAACLDLLKKYFCMANFDTINKHLKYVKKNTDYLDYVVLNKSFMTIEDYLKKLERDLIDNFNGNTKKD